MTPDTELLRKYAEHRDEAAFAEVVRRQVDLVYSAALRVVQGDAHLAGDVTQHVFTQLARLAGPLSHHPAIVGWLYVTARHTAIKAIRGEQRRRVREHEATTMHDPNPPVAVNWEQLRPLLDEAVDRLPARDRDAVLLRFFQGRSHREIGDQLGLTEDTARKRIERSLEKLRAYFTRRGVGVSSALLAEAITANSVQAAPAGLATRVIGTSLAGLGGVGVGGIFWRILFMSTKNKITLAVVLVLAVIAWLGCEVTRPAASSAVALLASARSTPSVAPAKTAASLSTKIAPPVAAPVSAPATTPQTSTASPPPDAKADPHLELSTTIDEIANLLQSGNEYAVRMNYSTPDSVAKVREVFSPGQLAAMEGGMSALTDPRLQAYAQVYQSLKGKEPEMNAVGDEATYYVTPPPGVSDREALLPYFTVTFQKIDGKWYLKEGPWAL